MPQDPRDPRDDEPGEGRSDEERPSGRGDDAADGEGTGDGGDRDGARGDDGAGGVPDDLAGLNPDDIPDDLSGLDLGDLPAPPVEPRLEPGGPGNRQVPRRPGEAAGAGADANADADGSVSPDDRAGGAGTPGSRQPGSGSAAASGDGDGEVPGPVPTGGPVDPRTPWQRLRDRYVDIRVVTMDRDGGPGLVLRWTARAPLVSTLLLAVLVAGVLVVTFGVPPVSPLFLIPVVCGPVYPWLRLESRAQAAWRDRDADGG